MFYSHQTFRNRTSNTMHNSRCTLKRDCQCCECTFMGPCVVQVMQHISKLHCSFVMVSDVSKMFVLRPETRLDLFPDDLLLSCFMSSPPTRYSPVRGTCDGISLHTGVGANSSARSARNYSAENTTSSSMLIFTRVSICIKALSSALIGPA